MNRTMVRRYFGYFVIVAVSVTVISVYSASLLRREAYDRTVDILEGTNQAAHNILNLVSLDEVGLFIENVAIDDIRISVIRDDGVVMADSQADVAELDNHADRPEIQAAYNGIQGISIRFSNSLGEELVYVAHPIVNSDKGSLVVRSSMSVKDIDEPLGDTLLSIIVIGIVTFLALSLISYFSERRLIAPFADIQQAAVAYMQGDLDHYLSIDSPEDARVVADAMNDMADAIKSRLTEITDSRNELDAIFAGITEALLVLDEDLNILQLNHAAIRIVATGVTNPVGVSLIEAFRSIHLQELAEQLKNSPSTMEEVVVFENQQNQTFQVRGSPVDSDSNRASNVAYVIVMTDITKMQHLETMRKDFVANVSHELKTPITNVKGYLETLSDGAIEDVTTSKRFLSIAVRNADRLNSIIDDLIILSRLEQHKGDVMETITRSVDGVIGSALQTCTPKASGKNIELKLEGDLKVAADINSLLIEQALINLIDNAVKYSPEDSVVGIRVYRDEEIGKLVISVKDKGLGIPEVDLPRIFERFYRVDRARSRELGGTGLGLAIVKHIAMIHGGSIRVESQLGQGSTFYFSLPAV